MSTTGKNFVLVPATISGSAASAVIAATPSASANLVANAGGTILDRFLTDLSQANLAKNGGAFLALAVSTPATLDLTNLAAAATAAAGDTSFATVNLVTFNNTGAADVVVTPGGSNPFNGPITGGTPGFTVPAGGQARWHSPAGWAVSGSAKTFTFSSGAAVGAIGVCVGGS